MKIKANYHTHTKFCDGVHTPEEMAAAAWKQGFSHLGFSAHGYTWFDPEFHLDTETYFQTCRKLAENYHGKMEILVGIEQDALADTELNLQADYLIGSTHYLKFDDRYLAVDYSCEMTREICETYFGGDYYRYCKAYYEQEAQVYERTHCDFIGHFDLVSRFNDEMHSFDEQDPRYLIPAKECMEYLCSKGIPFEINTGALNRGRKAEPYPSCTLLKALKEFGGEILFSSDAHSAELLNGGFDRAVQMALAAGFTHTNYLSRNGWIQLPLDEMSV